MAHTPNIPEDYVAFDDLKPEIHPAIADPIRYVHLMWTRTDRVPAYPYLGNGLRMHNTPTTEAWDYGVHAEDREELLHRFGAYAALLTGEFTEEGQPRPITRAERRALGGYLQQILTRQA